MNTPTIEAHGKLEDDKFQPTMMEQVWGHGDTSRYGTLDPEEYLSKINGMTRADLEAHARLMGVVIVEHTARLRDKLLADFHNYVALVRKPLESPKPQGKVNAAALSVLAEGR